MTYNEIIQKAGKEIEPLVYYFDEQGNQIRVDRDNFVRAKIFFNVPLIGTVMQGIELELYEQLPNVPIYFDITAKFGVENAKKEYGPYYLQKTPTFNADKKSYTHNLYDEMITTMVDYEPLSVEFPISIFDFFSALCAKCGFRTNITSLPNGEKQIEKDIYQDIGFTIRDIFHDIGQATATLFQIENKEIKELRFGTEENVVNDDILKNTNIEMGQHFGPINTIVLARGGDSDRIYYPQVLPESPIEYKISENQLMNENNRNEFMPAIYEKLNGIEFDIFDCELTGFGGFKPLAKVKIETDGKEFNSFVFNNEQVITQGYEEVIYSELPEGSETDFKAADTTDKRINEAWIKVNKQEKRITSLISEVDDQSQKISQVEQSVDNIKNLFQITGGNNLIKDSQWLLGDNVWEKQEGGEYEGGYDTSLIGKTVAISKIKVKNGKVNTTANNITSLIVGQQYALSYKISNEENTITTVRLIGNTTIYEKTFEEVTDFLENTITFIPNTPNLVFEIESSTTIDGSANVYDLMLNKGDISSWEPAAGEIVGTVLKLSQLGLQIYCTGSDIATLMTSQGFQIRRFENDTLYEIVTEFTKDGFISKKGQLEEVKVSSFDMKTINYQGYETLILYKLDGGI